MSLTPGTRLGSYEIVAAIGAGGMGEVYRARDTKLDRQVAIKIVPDIFAGDSERLARFEREAKTLASLNHPHIAQIYGFEESQSTRALVMELVDGEDLSAIIARGPLPFVDALPIARQIANALEAAHEQGIVHRDLKPANVKVRADGAVKVLDFGLAKALGPEGPSATADVMNSPTLTARATQMGVILGTAAYMSPEQAKGKPVDKRADIWAFGVVLYEMLTGRRLFVADSIPETLAHVMTRDVHLSALPVGTPANVKKLLERCLAKDPKQRLRDIGDARLMLEEKPEPVAPPPPPLPARAPLTIRILFVASIALFALSAAALVISRGTRSESDVPSTHLSIALPPGEQVTSPAAVSPDGKMIAYAAGKTRETSQLYLRPIDSFTSRAVPSSGGALYPFFSPDGQSIAFFAGGKLWRTLVAGGAPTAVTPAPRPWGGSWCADGTIIYTPNLNAGLWRVAGNGGTGVQVTKPDGAGAGYAHVYPQCLPGTDDVLFSFWGQAFYTAVLSKNGTWRQATPNQRTGGGPSIGLYAPNGYLLSGDSASSVIAIDWTPDVTMPREPQTVVIDNVYWITSNERVWLNVSASGTAVYTPGNPMRRHLVWVDRQGRVAEIPGDADDINEATVSRDGKRIIRHGRTSQWVEDLEHGTRTRILNDVRTFSAGWAPGEDRVVVSSNKDGDWNLYTIGANGGGDMTPILRKRFTQQPMSYAPDGSLVYLESHPTTANDLWVLAREGATRPLVVTPFNETSASVSWDGKYVAYTSDESGRSEVYAIPFSGTGDRVTVSIDGGTGPVWSRDGRELFYRAGDYLMSAEVRSMTPLALGARKKLLDVSAYEPAYFHDFDVSADGQRFLFIRADPDARPTRINVITNWFPELKRLVGK